MHFWNIMLMAQLHKTFFLNFSPSSQQTSSNTLHYIHIEQLDKVQSKELCHWQWSNNTSGFSPYTWSSVSLRFQRAHLRSWSRWQWCTTSLKTSRPYCSHIFDWPMVSQITRRGCRLCRPDCMPSLFWVSGSHFPKTKWQKLLLQVLTADFFCFFAVYSNALQESANSILYNGLIEELVDVLQITDKQLVVRKKFPFCARSICHYAKCLCRSSICNMTSHIFCCFFRPRLL